MATATEPKRIWRDPSRPSPHPDRIVVRRAKYLSRGVPELQAHQASVQVEKAIGYGDPLQVRLPNARGQQGIWAILEASRMWDLRRGGPPPGSILDADVQVWMMGRSRFFHNHLQAVRNAGRGRVLP